LNISPIGVIRNPTKHRSPDSEGTAEARIEVREKFAGGLEGIEESANLLILYWMHLNSPPDRKVLLVHPRGNPSRELRGVFSTRSPRRPNPIGITRVKVLKREGNVLVVEGLDAMDGSPLLDIKKG